MLQEIFLWVLESNNHYSIFLTFEMLLKMFFWNKNLECHTDSLVVKTPWIRYLKVLQLHKNYSCKDVEYHFR